MDQMKVFVSSVLIFISLFSFGQDYSHIGKKIEFSTELKNAKKFKDIDLALTTPDQVIYLELWGSKDASNIKCFFENIDKFKNLRRLHLINYYGAPMNISEKLWTQTNLEYLVIGNCQDFSMDGIINLKSLKYLSLYGCGFNEFPLEILSLTNLEFLDLSCNFLSYLPANIGELKNLKELELTNNCFNKVPEEIVKLEALQYLTFNNADQGTIFVNGKTVCDNSVTEVPTFFNEMKNLMEVSFFKVQIDDQMMNKIKSTCPKIKFGK